MKAATGALNVYASDAVEEIQVVQYPSCGESFEVPVDTTVSEQYLTLDCEVCCRPMEVMVRCEPGRVLELDVRGP